MTTAEVGRTLVAERGLTPAAVGALTPLMTEVGFEELGIVKALLLRFFSTNRWTAIDAADLARAVGRRPAGADVIHHQLAPDLTLVAGWVDDQFLLDVEVTSESKGGAADVPLDLGGTFASGIVPKPTPNPRTIRFATARRAVVASTSYQRTGDHLDEPVAAIFAAEADVVDVLVGADFVAVSLSRPSRWPAALEPVLAAVAAGFAGDTSDAELDEPAPQQVEVRGGLTTTRSPFTAPPTQPGRPVIRQTRLDRAWAELGRLDAALADDRRLLLIAAQDPDSARRQVAAQLLDRAPLDEATQAWEVLVADPSRAVRRAALDAVVAAESEQLRLILEGALTDSDPWVRWKALHGLVVLGPAPSLAAIAGLEDDPDFRVRLEAANARRGRTTP